MFTPPARADQRVKGGLYLRGLLLDGRRQSMQPMAGRLGVDHQQLQQFMTTSTWQVEAVRTRLARRAVAVLRPQVWVVDDTGIVEPGYFRADLLDSANLNVVYEATQGAVHGAVPGANHSQPGDPVKGAAAVLGSSVVHRLLQAAAGTA
ncbi:transposase [Streptomyces sp. NPDC052015]|uniref:transposase n=1 Tax=Streptomyces sp. NPDC052015 TaxID=3154755 RepID=UPI00343E688A